VLRLGDAADIFRKYNQNYIRYRSVPLVRTHVTKYMISYLCFQELVTGGQGGSLVTGHLAELVTKLCPLTSGIVSN
jgi:hypothetical protein